VILSIKLRYLDSWNSQRREKAAVYSEFLSRVPGVAVPKELPAAKPVWNQYTIRLTSQDTIRLTSQDTIRLTSQDTIRPTTQFDEPSASGNFRDSMRTKLQEAGIGSMVYYPLPLHLQPVYKSLGYQAGQLPVAEQVCREVLSLPMFPELSRDQQERAIYGLKDCLAKGG
jgi:dTDP-4-amino-4,6-dideoxygalactose transaminase